MTNLVATAHLAEHLDHVVVLDATWHLPTAKRDAEAEYLAAHIPAARFFDIDKTSDASSPLPHTLPTAQQFADQMGALGISNTTQVVAYDSYGLFSAARCWWMFKTMGHDKVAVLDGGLKKWLAEGRAVESGKPATTLQKTFSAKRNAAMLRNIDQVAEGQAQIADARSPTRFRGEEPEPRPGVRPGHIPGARCVHYSTLLNADGTMRSKTELAAIFAAAGVDIAKPVITSCGSGVTAAILSLALTELGAKDHALFDGSWTEWVSSTRKVEMGPAR